MEKKCMANSDLFVCQVSQVNNNMLLHTDTRRNRASPIGGRHVTEASYGATTSKLKTIKKVNFKQ
jgi:hypothetical protein